MAKRLTEFRFPDELKTMSQREQELLAVEIRDFLIHKVALTGGHLASNLGVVELSIALHSIFNSPEDKIIWDVGHQCYVHKILTGRAADFDRLRQKGGIAGFPKRSESPHDFSDNGHSSNSVSQALGAAIARDLSGKNNEVVAVIGDGALTGGLAYEALNHAGNYGGKLIVVLNDNEMSICENVGAVAQHLGRLRTSGAYLTLKRQMKQFLKSIPMAGSGLYSSLERVRNNIRGLVLHDGFFEQIGFKYFGPIDGHDLEELEKIFSVARMCEGPVLIHVVTQKGKGYRNAEQNPSRFHQVERFDPASGRSLAPAARTYYQVFGEKLTQLAEKDERVIGISAAMTRSTGISILQERFPERVFDVGIAEEHAVSMAAGMALCGLRPVVAIYSTFLQRSYDQIVHDICLQDLPVVFALNNAGVVGSDGPTHHGVFDISYLSHVPNMRLLAPKDAPELERMLAYALAQNGPTAIRFPRGAAAVLEDCGAETPLDGSAELIREGSGLAIFAVGRMLRVALDAAELLQERGISAQVWNARFVSPFDRNALRRAAERCGHIITLEDNVLRGGYGEAVAAYLCNEKDLSVLPLGWPDAFPGQATVDELFADAGLTAEAVAERAVSFLG